MITTIIITLLFLWVAALPIAACLDRKANGRLLLGEAALLGAASAPFVLALLSALHVAWSLPLSVALMLLLSSAAALLAWRRRRAVPAVVLQGNRLPAILFDLATFSMFLGFILFATLARPWEWDYWAIWGLKGRIFFLQHRIDAVFLTRPWNSFAHSDYPPLLPLLYSFLAMVQGVWEDRWFGLSAAIFGAGALLSIRALMAELTGSRVWGAVAALGVSGIVLSNWIGMAEGALIAYLTVGLLLVRRDLADDEAQPIGAVMLGLAASTKNEGLSLLIAATIGLFLVRWRNPRALFRLWPAFVIALPWQLYTRFGLSLSTDLFQGPIRERAVEGGERLARVFRALAANPPDHLWFWIGIVLVVIAAWRTIVRTERFLLITIVTQVVFYVGTYLVTPHDIFWHIANSWVRILSQIGAIAACMAFLVIAGETARAEAFRADGSTEEGTSNAT